MPQDNRIPKPLRTKMARYMVNEILAHLGAAISQALPSDDQIIMQHVHEARALADALATAINQDKQDRILDGEDANEETPDADAPATNCG